MTEEELDVVYEVRERIEKAVSIIVDAGLEMQPLTPEQDELIRMQLTENYRFWKR